MIYSCAYSCSSNKMASSLSRIPRCGSIGSTVFFNCDIQQRFVPLIYRMPTVIATATALLKTAQATGRPVICTEQYPKVFGSTVPELTKLLPGTHIFPKMTFSMLTDDVSTHLASSGYDSAVLFGIETHVCVQHTCFDLLRDGKQVFVVADGCSSQRKGDRAFALRHMQVWNNQIKRYMCTNNSCSFTIKLSACRQQEPSLPRQRVSCSPCWAVQITRCLKLCQRY
jgi:nicotinamidase-related amidase